MVVTPFVGCVCAHNGRPCTSCQALKLGKCVNFLVSRVVSQASLSSGAAMLSNKDTSSSLSRHVSFKASRNNDNFEEQNVSLSVDPTRYDSRSGVVYSEAAVCHNNCASLLLILLCMVFWIPLMFVLIL